MTNRLPDDEKREKILDDAERLTLGKVPDKEREIAKTLAFTEIHKLVHTVTDAGGERMGWDDKMRGNSIASTMSCLTILASRGWITLNESGLRKAAE